MQFGIEVSNDGSHPLHPNNPRFGRNEPDSRLALEQGFVVVVNSVA